MKASSAPRQAFLNPQAGESARSSAGVARRMRLSKILSVTPARSHAAFTSSAKPSFARSLMHQQSVTGLCGVFAAASSQVMKGAMPPATQVCGLSSRTRRKAPHGPSSLTVIPFGTFGTTSPV